MPVRLGRDSQKFPENHTVQGNTIGFPRPRFKYTIFAEYLNEVHDKS